MQHFYHVVEVGVFARWSDAIGRPEIWLERSLFVVVAGDRGCSDAGSVEALDEAGFAGVGLP